MVLKTAFGLLLCSSIPMWAISAYTVTTSDQFGTVNLSTGVFSFVGTAEVGSTPESLSAGLAEVGGNLYGAETGTGNFWEINPASGALTSIGSSGEFQDLGSTLTTIYVVGANSELYSVNPSNGAFTDIGPTGLAEPGTSSLSTNSSTLYFAEYNSGYKLYTINTSTGAATLVGSTATPIGALIWDGTSVLYGAQEAPDPSSIITVNTTNGAVTTGSAVTGTASDLNGLAAIPAVSGVPEPGSWGLLGLGLLAIGRLRRR
jgi:hypothetical protein